MLWLGLGGRLYIANNEDTVVAIIRHPVAQGVKNNYFYQVGRLLHQRWSHVIAVELCVFISRTG